MITSFTISPLLAGSAIFVFLLSSRFLKKIPPALSALVSVVLLAVIMGEFNIRNIQDKMILPQIIMPEFSLDAIVSIGIPLALLIICSENAQATGVLTGQGYKPPNTAMAVYGSIVGLITAFFGGHSTCYAWSFDPFTQDGFFR